MLKINVAEVFGIQCVSPEKGIALFRLMEPAINSGQTVELEFSGVQVCASPFLNFSVGMFFKSLSNEDFGKRILILGMSDSIREVLDRVIKNSSTYFADPTTRIAIDHLNDNDEDEEF